ncbi:hypothetical protein F2Q70_00022454 [Brassica cretica]|nr:hypothetical protein F2Q70_00022454 [Brassica cretica]
MPNSTKSNKEIQLLFSSVHASLECSIRKERRSSLIDNNTGSSLDSRQPPSTQTPISSTDPRSPPSTEATFLSTDIFHPASIDTSVRTSIDTEPRDMIATLILVRDDNRDLHDQEGHLRNTAEDDFWLVVKHETLQEGDFEVESSISFGGSHWCRSTPDFEYRSTDVNHNRSIASPEHRSTTPAKSTAYCNAVRIMAREEFAVRHPHPPSPIYVSIDRQTDSAIDRERETVIDRQPPAPIVRRTPLTYRVQLQKINVAHLNHSGHNPNLQLTHQRQPVHIQKMQQSLWKLIRLLWGEP